MQNKLVTIVGASLVVVAALLLSGASGTERFTSDGIPMAGGRFNLTKCKTSYRVKKDFLAGPSHQVDEIVRFQMPPGIPVSHYMCHYIFEGEDMLVSLHDGGVGYDFVEYRIVANNVRFYDIQNYMF